MASAAGAGPNSRPTTAAASQGVQMNSAALQRALEVSVDRWTRFFLMFRDVYCNKEFAKKKLGEVVNRVGVGFGVFSRKNVSTANDTNLLGASLLALAYSLTVCWGQFYVMFWVFATWLSGSMIIFLLFRMLGSSHGLAEVTSTIGYAIAPLVFLEPLMTLTEGPLPGLSMVIKIGAVAWASRTASLALIQPSTEKNIFLFACPLMLYNVFLLSLRSGA